MLQNNPILNQLKQQLNENKLRVEGIVKNTGKSFGFLEISHKKSYFLPPPAMKKLMHGDKIQAVIEKNNDKEQAHPEKLIEPILAQFVAKIHFDQHKPYLLADHVYINERIYVDKVSVDKVDINNVSANKASVNKENIDKVDVNNINAEKMDAVVADLIEGDWVVAQLVNHPLRDQKPFLAQITQFICHAGDHFAPWWVTLARHNQSRHPVKDDETYALDESFPREDLTALHFVTIDALKTEDIDDALCIEPIITNAQQTGWKLVVAIADPTAYISVGSAIDNEAKQRCFTNYLPGFNINMLPSQLSNNLCSLLANQKRPALVCYIETDMLGELISKPTFTAAWITVKERLNYDSVSDFLEKIDNHWQSEQLTTTSQINRLHEFAFSRITWRNKNALPFKENPSYYFVLEQDGKVKDILIEHRRIAHQIIEECMILANSCAAQYLQENAGCAVFSTHSGFDKKFINNARNFLLSQLVTDENESVLTEKYSVDNLSTLSGYCAMRRDILAMENTFLELRLRRFLTFAEFKVISAPHFGLGLNEYATWTSPIRKYSDMVNHRLIKQCLLSETPSIPESTMLSYLQQARKQNRLVERGISDWLYSQYLSARIDDKTGFDAEVIDITRGGLKVRLCENGATLFIPISSLHDIKEEIFVDSDEITLYIKDEKTYRLGDIIQARLKDVNIETRSIVGEIS